MTLLDRLIGRTSTGEAIEDKIPVHQWAYGLHAVDGGWISAAALGQRFELTGQELVDGAVYVTRITANIITERDVEAALGLAELGLATHAEVQSVLGVPA